MKKTLISSFVLSVAIWACFTWPLPLYLRAGIPSSASNIEAGHVRTMIAGDHLQILYHFWLFEDALFGKTPWFTNPYEFRTSDAPPDRRLRSYYLPFSVLFALLSPICGRAFAWNVTGFLSVWLSCFAAWLLTRRYTRHEVLAAGSACMGLLLPFRWHALMGGSPTGLSLCLVPVVLLGIDLAVREAKTAGAVLGGCALVAAALSDRHVFFFATLASPFWILFAALAGRLRDDRVPELRLVSRALVPLPLFFTVAFVLLMATSRNVEKSVMAGGRTLQEVALFSRTPDGLFMPGSILQSEIHLGLILPALLLLCFGALFWSARRRDREAFSSVVLLALALPALFLVVAAALGANGPLHGAFFLWCRKVIPKYDMIRQPAKVFCLLLSVLPVVLALAAGPWLRRVPFRSGAACVALVVLLIAVEQRRWVNSTICILRSEHPAYEAAAAHPEDKPSPHVMLVPLWPGDSHWSSLYEHYVSLYRMPMLNGYSPAVPLEYADDIYPGLSSVNKGMLGAPELSLLRGMGITRIIFHENAFPEKVSPFPGCHTLKRFLDHPGLRLLASSGGAWAFEVLESGQAGVPVGTPEWNVYCPSRTWPAIHGRGENVELVREDGASRGAFLRMGVNGASVAFPETRAVMEPELRALVRMRGEGVVNAEVLSGDVRCVSREVAVNDTQWEWYAVAIPPFEGQSFLKVLVSLRSGAVDVDSAILAAGRWSDPRVGDAIRIPAPCLFHYGETDVARNSVLLKQDAVASYEAIYGPCMPLDPGECVVRMAYGSTARPGTLLGSLALRRDGRNIAEVPVTAGSPAVLRLELRDNRPVSVYFLFAWTGDVEVREFVIERREPGREQTASK